MSSEAKLRSKLIPDSENIVNLYYTAFGLSDLYQCLSPGFVVPSTLRSPVYVQMQAL